MTRNALILAAAAAALALVPAAGAVGPSLPAVSTPVTLGASSYVAKPTTGSTTLLSERVKGKLARQESLAGLWGVPMVTLGAPGVGGLSPNGRILVLSDNVNSDGTLRDRSRFAVVETRTLAVVRTIALRGDYSFDALSPAGRWLYLIHHVASTGDRYQVMAYDLRAGRLLPGVIADKRQAGWLMAGYPVSRATGSDGRWVYTLYQQSNNYPFVHALDTVNRTAICIGLPWKWWKAADSIGRARLTLDGHTLNVAGGKARFALDTSTFRVTGG